MLSWISYLLCSLATLSISSFFPPLWFFRVSFLPFAVDYFKGWLSSCLPCFLFLCFKQYDHVVWLYLLLNLSFHSLHWAVATSPHSFYHLSSICLLILEGFLLKILSYERCSFCLDFCNLGECISVPCTSVASLHLSEKPTARIYLPWAVCCTCALTLWPHWSNRPFSSNLSVWNSHGTISDLAVSLWHFIRFLLIILHLSSVHLHSIWLQHDYNADHVWNYSTFLPSSWSCFEVIR